MIPVPRTFCVTLRETPNRKIEAQKYFAQVGLNAEFIDSIHGPSFGLKTTIPNYNTLPGREYFITPGVVGCILSHVMLWNILLTQPEEEFLVVEDDVLLCDDFFEKFAKLKLELPIDWEFVYVGWLPIVVDEDKVIKISENISNRKANGTHAYLVKKSALKILIETNQIAWDGLDNQIRQRTLPKINYYTFEPSLVSQRSVKNVQDETWYSLCYDWGLNPEWLKDASNVPMIMGNGWYPLEKNSEGYMIWSDGRGEFLIDGEWIKMSFDYIAEGDMEKKLRVICPSQNEQIFELKHGLNHVTIDLGGAKSVILVTDTFKPSDIYKTSDCRRLGIRILKGINLIDKNGKTTFVSLYSMYGQKKFGDGNNKASWLKNFKVTESNDDGKINLSGQTFLEHHRSGWQYVLKSLSPYHREEATLFDGSLEKTFALQKDQNAQLRLIPYREPWVGVFHTPPNTPSWCTHNGTPSAIILSKEFQDSLGTCKGLYTLSEYHSEFLRCYIKTIPIETLYHSTEVPEVTFNLDEFVKNTNKKVVNIGYWLRKLSSIYQLNVDQSIYQKVRLLPPISWVPSNVEQILEVESRVNKCHLTEEMKKSVVDLRFMSNHEYDNLLSKNIVFVDYYDCSASNVIIECMARNTPILVNPLPAVVEYLGEGYPFYFTTLADASKKINNLALIRATHEYLVNSSVKEKITSDYFLKTIREGKIWQSLL